MSDRTDALMRDYRQMKDRIRTTLLEFEGVGLQSGERIFEEMAFCLCTPQSNARSCFSAVRSLAEADLLLRGTRRAVGNVLRGRVRFHNTKAGYILEARRTFRDQSGRPRIMEKLGHGDPVSHREWLVRTVKGLGYKEAGHFLRNIGM